MTDVVLEDILRLLGNIKVVLRPDFLYGDKEIPYRGFILLEAIGRSGSLRKAAESIGVDYKTLWDIIHALEETLGVPLVERRAGGRSGGGANLTLYGEAILALFRLVERKVEDAARELNPSQSDVIVIGSDCAIMEKLVEELADRGVYALYIKTGSSLGLYAIKRGLCHIAGVHILDWATGKYNEHLLRDPEIKGRIVLVKGWKRVIGLAYSKNLKPPPKNLEDVYTRGLRLANRVRGSGTRIFLDYMLTQLASSRGVPVSQLKRKIKGYSIEYNTHGEAAQAVASGKADVTITTEYVAKLYGLGFVPLTIEDYDLLVKKDILDRLPLKELSPFKGRDKLQFLE